MTGGSTREDTLAQTNATFSLLLPGDVLDLTALNNQRKFRDKGNKAGAKLGWDLLEKSGLGPIKQKNARRGTDVVSFISCILSTHTFLFFHRYINLKKGLPEGEEEKIEFAKTLAQFGVSLQQYTRAFEMPNVTVYVG